MISPHEQTGKDLTYIAEHVEKWPEGADFIYLGNGSTIHIIEGGSSSACKYISREQWAAARTLLGYWFPEKNVWPDERKEDLKWLAERVTNWIAHDRDSIRRDGSEGWAYTQKAHGIQGTFTREEWQAARDQLEDERMGIVARNGNDGLHYPEQAGKQARYQDSKGEDWIDEFARTATPEEFRGAMRFTLGKYVRRVGKKDALESEIEKIRDYAARWLEVEKGR